MGISNDIIARSDRLSTTLTESTQKYDRLGSMNTKLVDSLVQVILSLSDEEPYLLEEKLFFNSSYPSTPEIMELAQNSKAFEFLHNEPDLYTLDDGEFI